MTFYQLNIIFILLTCCFVNLPFCQPDILSTWHFVNLTFCQLAILSTYYFVHLPCCQLTISSTCHFANFHRIKTAKSDCTCRTCKPIIVGLIIRISLSSIDTCYSWTIKLWICKILGGAVWAEFSFRVTWYASTME
jgi:hypothetical protein